MNTALPEVMHCLNNQATMSVLERQHERIKWQQDHMNLQPAPEHPSGYFNGSELSMFSLPAQGDQPFQGLMGNLPNLNLDELMNRALKPDPGLESNGWPDFGKFDDHHQMGYYGASNVPGFDMQHTLMRMASCPPSMAAVVAEMEVKATNSSPVPGRENTKKRKPDKTHNLKVLSEEGDTKDEKKIKSCTDDEDSKITNLYSNNSNKNNNKTVNENNTTNSRENSADATSKEKSKVSEAQKTDYIHVRARRGQATDSHSLAERVRREKISERMKYLQDLVPGCNKITGKAGMLDEIINYVQSLQRQVEFLSMKLAAVNPRLDFNIDNFIAKEMFPSSTTEFSMIGGVSSEMANPGFLQLNPLQQMVSCCGMEMGMSPADMALRRTISAPVSVPESFIDSSCFNQQIQPQTTWDATAITNLYGLEFQQGSSSTFASQQFTGSHQGGNLKMEM